MGHANEEQNQREGFKQPDLQWDNNKTVHDIPDFNLALHHQHRLWCDLEMYEIMIKLGHFRFPISDIL